jgi:hypothetical protein
MTSDIAGIQFLDVYANQIAIPHGFTLIDSANQNVPQNLNLFLIMWVHSYELKFNGSTIWKMVNQKQQSVMSANKATIRKTTIVNVSVSSGDSESTDDNESEDMTM